MKICVFGAGSLGSAVGGLLADCHDVTLIGRTANITPISQAGLVIQGAVCKKVRMDASDSVDELSPPDLLIVATKAYSTSSVVEACADWIRDDTAVLTLQNGLGNLEQLRSWRGDKAFGGTTTMGAYLTEPGTVRIASVGKTIIGSDLDGAMADSIAAAFRASGIPAETKRDILSEMWAKTIVNACINPLTAVLRVPNGDLLRSITLTRLIAEICSEGEAVAQASGIALPVRSMYERTCDVAEETARNKSSMLRDIELGRRTEIDSINGHICRHGDLIGVSTPLNGLLVSLVKSLETGASEKA